MHVSPSTPAPHHRCDGNRPSLPSQQPQNSSNVVLLQSSSLASSSNFTNSSFSANGAIISSSSYSSSRSYYSSTVIGTTAGNDRVSIDNFKVFDALLKRAYEQLSTRHMEYAAPLDEPLSAETAAGNILGFIEARLRRDQAEGASAEQLQERLNQGLEGFKKGFGQAREQIEALGLLSAEIEEDIGLTYDLVLDGIDDLRRQYVTGESNDGADTAPVDEQTGPAGEEDGRASHQAEPAEPAPFVAAARTESSVVRLLSSFQSIAPSNSDSHVRQIHSFHKPKAVAPAADSGNAVVEKPGVERDRETAPAPSLSASYGSYSYGQLNSFSFELETADGDKVTINVRTKDFYMEEYRAGSFDDGGSVGGFEDFSDKVFSSSRFQLEIDGELDEDELAAIDVLLTQVEDLSIDFFAGDLESAYQQALNLGYDAEEIVNFSLNLRQVEVERFTAAYQAVAPVDAGAPQPLAQRLQPLGHFVKDLLDAVDTASTVGDGSRLVADVAEQMGEAYDNHPRGHRFGQFVRDLLDSLPQQ